MTRNTDPSAGSDVPCRACGATFKAGIFCFYRLCDVCFPKFDEQKTQLRLAKLRGQQATGTESIVEWLAKRKAVLAAWAKAVQALLDAEHACAQVGVDPTQQPLDPVVQFGAANSNATHYEVRTLEWAAARSATTLVQLKRTNAPPELLESCKRLLQERVERLPQYSVRSTDDLLKARSNVPDTTPRQA